MRYVEESMKGKESDAIIPWEGSRREVAICEHFEGEVGRSEKKRELCRHNMRWKAKKQKKKKIGTLYRRTRKHTTTTTQGEESNKAIDDVIYRKGRKALCKKKDTKQAEDGRYV